MQKIVPHFWFEREAKEAVAFYTSLFPESRILNTTTLHDTPSGDCDVVRFQVWGYEFMAISLPAAPAAQVGAGSLFTLNPSISFMVNFDPSQDTDARTRIDALWEKLIEGGTALMPIDAYPFSERYGWVQDKYGVSWQLIYTNPEGEERPLIIPSLLFVTDAGARAEEATDFYLAVFKDSQRGSLVRYPAGSEPNKEGSVMFTDFKLEGQWFAAMDGSAAMHAFNFNEAISLMVKCDTQDEIDYYWEKLSAVPEAEQCGWLKDRFGVSWQIVPRVMDEMITSGTDEQKARVTEAFLKMKKFDLAALNEAFGAEPHRQ